MIVITTPVGQIGRQVLGNLLESGEQLRVIARDPSQLPADISEDLDIVEGSHGDAAVVDKAFAGADAVFWVTPLDPRAPSVDAAFAGFTRPAAEAFHRHGVGRVVGVSMLGRGTPWAAQAGFATGSLAMDDLIAASGVAYRALANPYFMEDTARQAQSIKNQGLFFYPIAGDRKYGGRVPFPNGIALHSRRLVVEHQQRGRRSERRGQRQGRDDGGSVIGSGVHLDAVVGRPGHVHGVLVGRSLTGRSLIGSGRGLTGGEQVVLDAPAGIKEGARVRIKSSG